MVRLLYCKHCRTAKDRITQTKVIDHRRRCASCHKLCYVLCTECDALVSEANTNRHYCYNKHKKLFKKDVFEQEKIEQDKKKSAKFEDVFGRLVKRMEELILEKLSSPRNHYEHLPENNC